MLAGTRLDEVLALLEPAVQLLSHVGHADVPWRGQLMLALANVQQALQHTDAALATAAGVVALANKHPEVVR